MQRETTKSSMTLVLLFSAFAVVTAIVILAIAVFTGRTTSFEDATRFEQRTTPDVRYVINYEIEPELFSFYTNERQAASPGAAVAQSRANSAIR